MWAAALAVAWTGCFEPEPQTLTLPTLADKERQVREAMAGFNEARFQEEREAIVAAIRQTPSFGHAARRSGPAALVAKLHHVDFVERTGRLARRSRG